jgi:malate dehydrogenase (oxaloacetate-decarboxylating)(NADP+)
MKEVFVPDHQDANCSPRPSCPLGYELLQDPLLNKGTSFTEQEQRALKLEGLLPPGHNTMDEQVKRVMGNFGKMASDIDKYSFMMALLERDRSLFDRVVLDHLEEMMPIIYTPTVGRASQMYSHIFQKPQGIFLSEKYHGRFPEILRNWPIDDVRIVVITDGERVLGLGDLGVSGMAIPVGKLILYVVCAGIRPSWCLPVVLDVGTNNASLLNDPLYLGLKHKRIRGEYYDELIEEFVAAVQERYPDAIIHFEDFGNVNAFRLLKEYRQKVCAFNDDIQGTASVTAAGLFAAMRKTGGRLKDQKILFLGAGAAGIGIGEMIVTAMIQEGLSEAEARRRCWYVDSKGLIVKQREHLTETKRLFAHEHPYLNDFISSLKALKPTAIVGVSGQPGKFDQGVLTAMAEYNQRPIIFALSNPTSKSECTAEEAYTWTQGRSIFASGSPFDPVTIENRTYVPSQCNNAYIFPGLGLGVIASNARHITDEMVLAAARRLAAEVSREDFEKGVIFPPFKRIRAVSLRIAAAVAGVACEQGLTQVEPPEDWEAFIERQMYEPRYVSYV